MPQTINIAVEISDQELSNAIMTDLAPVPDTTVQRWYGAMGDKGALAVKSSPDIIILDDDPETGEIFKRLPKLRHTFPVAAVFVVSNEKEPKHIVEVMKAGAREYLITPMSKNVLINAINEVRATLTETGKMAKGSVYSFISSKGGLGATLLAVNAAAALALNANNGNAIALCDMSLQSGDATVLLDILPETTIVDVCKNFHRLDVSLLKGAMIKHTSGLELLAAPTNPEDCEEIKVGYTEKIIELAIKLYDRVIIDCHSMTVNNATIEAFRASQKIFIVIDLSLPAIRNAVRLAELISKSGISREKIEFVLNRYEKGAVLSIEEVEKNLGKTIYWLTPNDFSNAMSSINEGKPLVQLHPGSPLAKNVTSLTEKLRNKLRDKTFRGATTIFGRNI